MPATSSSGDLSNLTLTTTSSQPLTPMSQSPSPSPSSSPPQSSLSLSNKVPGHCPCSTDPDLLQHDCIPPLKRRTLPPATITIDGPDQADQPTSSGLQSLSPTNSHNPDSTSGTHPAHPHQSLNQQRPMLAYHRPSSSLSSTSHPSYAYLGSGPDQLQRLHLNSSITSAPSSESAFPFYPAAAQAPQSSPQAHNHQSDSHARQAARQRSFRLNGHSINLRRASSAAGTRSLTQSTSSSSHSSTPPLPPAPYYSHSSQSEHLSNPAPFTSPWWMLGWLRGHENRQEHLNPSISQRPSLPHVASQTIPQVNRSRSKTSVTIDHMPIHSPVNGFGESRPPQLHSLVSATPQDDLNSVQRCSVSVTSSSQNGFPSTSHHHVSLDKWSGSQHDAAPSDDCSAGWNFEEDSQMVRHTTKLLKSRDSRTGRLIINQYMKGKEIGRGVHGVVYIGKNMDKVIRSSTPQPEPNSFAGSLSAGPQRLYHSQNSGNSPSAPMSASFSLDAQLASAHLNDSDSQIPSYRADEDYETVAIKVVRREPRGPKSLRRSQLQRQRERESMDAGLNETSQADHGRADSNGYNHRSLLSPDPTVGRVPLLKDVDDKLKKEIAIMKRLRHRHVVQLKEVIDDAKSKKVFMILEFMEGGQVLWQDPLRQTPLMTVEQARKTFRQVLLGLEYLHYQGIIHRDIKPANLLWTADRETVKISDFGVSHISGVLKRSASTSNLAANLVTDNGHVDGPRTTNSVDDKALRKTEGSPAFMAPELCCPIEPTPLSTPPERSALDYFTHKTNSSHEPRSEVSNGTALDPLNRHRIISLPLSPNTFSKGQRPSVGKGIDIWALGVTLYCLLFGRTPFNAPNEYELFNVIWNEPILVPDKMGVEGQAINFDPENRYSDGPVERDSRELVDLLRGLLEKDPRKRIQLKDVKTHPWVLNNLDNTQYWVNETAPIGCDAVHVTTEEVANFSRPRASLKVSKPLGGVKQSLRKAAIKLGLQRSSGRSQVKSAASPNSNSVPSTRLSSPTLDAPHPVLTVQKSSDPLPRRKIASITSNLHSSELHPLFHSGDVSPVTPAYLVSPQNCQTGPILRGFGGSSSWTSASTSQVSPVVASCATLPAAESQPSTPVLPLLPLPMDRSTPEPLYKPAPLNLCNSSFLSSFGSPLSNGIHHTIPHSSASSPRNSTVLTENLQRSINAHHPSFMSQSGLISQPDRIQQRRSLPTSPAPLHALVTLSRSSLVPSRTTSPIATSEGGIVKPSQQTRFRDALFRVRQRFSRSRSRAGSLTTTCNETASSDLDASQVRSDAAPDGSDGGEHCDVASATGQGRTKRDDRELFAPDSLSTSEVFNSDSEQPRSLHMHEENEDDAEADEEQEGEDDDDEDSSSTGHEARGPLMYHDGTKWQFPRLDSSATNVGHSESWTDILKNSMGTSSGRPENEPIWPGEPTEPANPSELTPRPQYPSDCLSEEADRLRQGMTLMRNAITEWDRPRLTVRPASFEEERVEYRSSDDDEDDDEIELAGHRRWAEMERGSSGPSNITDEEAICSQESDEDDGNCTLQIEVKRRKRGASRSEAYG